MKKNKCFLCGEVPKGPAIYRDIDDNDTLVNVRVHKDCYIRYEQKLIDASEMAEDFTDWYEQCIYYIRDLFNDDVDEYAIQRLEGLRQSRFKPDNEKRFKYLDERGYSYKELYQLFEQVWERKEIGWNWSSFEMRANTVFKPLVEALKQKAIEDNPYLKVG